MGLSFRKSMKIAPGIRLNLSKRGLGLSAGLRGARVSANTKGETNVSGGHGGLYYRKRLRRARREDVASHDEVGERNLAFATFVLEKARAAGLSERDEEVSDELIVDAAGQFFGDAFSPEARAGIAFVTSPRRSGGLS